MTIPPTRSSTTCGTSSRGSSPRTNGATRATAATAAREPIPTAPSTGLPRPPAPMAGACPPWLGILPLRRGPVPGRSSRIPAIDPEARDSPPARRSTSAARSVDARRVTDVQSCRRPCCGWPRPAPHPLEAGHVSPPPGRTAVGKADRMGPTGEAADPRADSPGPQSAGVALDGADAPTDASPVEPAGRAAVPESDNRSQEEITGYVRSPSDVLRTVVFALATLLLLVLATWSRDAVLALENDLIKRSSFLTPTVERILAGALTLVVLVSLAAAWATPLVTRRYRLFGYLLVGNILVPLLLRGVEWFLDRRTPDVLMDEVARRGGLDSHLTVYGIAQTATSFVVL